MLSTATDSAAIRLTQRAIDALTTEEAIAFYIEVLEVTKAAGEGLVKFSESIAADILHGLFYFLTLAVWGMVELWGCIATEGPRLVQDARFAIRHAVATVQAEPLALPWSAETPLSQLGAWSDEIEIVWPAPSPKAPQWVTGMMPFSAQG